MRLRRVAFACNLALVAPINAARGDEAKDLIFFSGALISGQNFAGLGWLHAASGLDLSGPVFALELGRQQFGQAYGQTSAGWRLAQPGFAFTLAGGVELAPASAPAWRPLGSADLWWEPAKGWMTTAFLQATPAYVSWRAAAGVRPAEDWPWIGPEAAASTGELRAGLHATGLRFGGDFEGRVSMGVSRWRCRSGRWG